MNDRMKEVVARQIVELQQELKHERMKVKLYQSLFKQAQEELEILQVCISSYSQTCVVLVLSIILFQVLLASLYYG
jgi:hypothetical protein